MARSQVISGLISKYDRIINGQDKSAIELAVFKVAICQLVDAAFSGGGGGGGTTSATVSNGIDTSADINTIVTALAALVAKPSPPTQTDIVAAIQAAADIDTIIARLASIDTKTISQTDIVTAIQTAADIETIITRLTSLDTGKLTQANIEGAIQSAADIDTIIARLTTIATNTTGGGGGTVSTSIATYTHSAPSITDAGTVVLAANTNRKGATIINRSATNSVDLFFGALGSYGAGLPLAPGQSYEINSTNLYTGVIRAIASAGNTVDLAVAEGV